MMNWLYGYGSMPYGGFGLLGPIFMIIFWIIVIILIVHLIRGGGRGVLHMCGGHGHNGGETALDILEKRYAQGEIDKKEFDERKKDLIKN